MKEKLLTSLTDTLNHFQKQARIRMTKKWYQELNSIRHINGEWNMKNKIKLGRNLFILEPALCKFNKKWSFNFNFNQRRQPQTNLIRLYKNTLVYPNNWLDNGASSQDINFEQIPRRSLTQSNSKRLPRPDINVLCILHGRFVS